MKRRICLALAASALLVAGCGAVSEVATPPPPTPAEKLKDAVPDGSVGNFRYTIQEMESNAKGEVNPADKRMTYTTMYKDKELGFTMTTAIVVIDKQAWMKITFGKTEGIDGLPKLPAKWLRIDSSKVDDKEYVSYTHPDPTGAAALFQHIVDAAETPQGAFTGTVDMAAAPEAEVVDAETLAALGDKAKAVPFRATVDSSGRLASLTLEVPAAGKAAAFNWVAKFTDYGSGPEIKEPPAAQTVPAPQAAYDLLNS